MPPFFIQRIRSEELKNRLIHLLEFKKSASETEALMIDVIIGLSSEIDRVSNPDLIDECFSIISKEVRKND